jgi:GNAT superfamily N-acetyltransferase
MTSVMRVQAPSAGFQGVSGVRVLSPAASDTQAVLTMLSRCSRATLFHRFHGVTDGADYFGALLRDGSIDQTFLAWYGSSCVGVATLGVGATGLFDLGVLIEDAWQRRGIGTWLVVSLLAGARAQGTTIVHADVLGDDLFILESLRRIGPLTVSVEFGIYSVDIDIGIGIGRQGNPSSGNSLHPSSASRAFTCLVETKPSAVAAVDPRIPG